MRKTWGPVETQFVIDNAPSMTDTQLWEALKKLSPTPHTLDSVRKFRQRKSLIKKRGRPPKEVEQKVTENTSDIKEQI